MTDHEAEVLAQKIKNQQNLTHGIGEGFGEAKRIIPVLKALGYENVHICGDCISLSQNEDRENALISSAVFKSVVTGPGEIVIYVSDGFLD